ncbi:hypothetical protein FISHEDRAFT_35157 [Fistulina hepatica ATCC 64428]|uniref:Coiled-coil domain-containing protein 16 n=1 Tax=Fistulina hepatica ATCC 64428 TaxID=1128425 RepID=A0A0D7AL04_9AGAR|nr:hypothetical protein FISHEDRAFT_35157 [Fistulina hepatica ATCC 64428]
MADVRALLKAKRKRAQISHPYALYTNSGDLRCKACGLPVKDFMWEGHIGSKKHRINAAQLREREEHEAILRAQRERDAERARNRVAPDISKAEPSEREHKRKALDDGDAVAPKKPKTTGFPADFFSDPNRRLEQVNDDESDENERIPPPSTTIAPDDPLAAELAQFEREVVNDAQAATEELQRDAYDRATVFAEPVLRDADEGLRQSAPEEASAEEETEEQKQQRKEQEERELIMDRLVDEEQAQEEADMRVVLMKRKLEEAKARRRLKLASKA